ncbi:hypothetical protein ACLBOM_21815 [Escherichia coli]
MKAWAALSEFTGRDHTHLALNKEDEKIRFRDIQAQPRKFVLSRPGLVWKMNTFLTTPVTPTFTS